MRRKRCGFRATVAVVSMIGLMAPQSFAGETGMAEGIRRDGMQAPPSNNTRDYTMPFELESGFLMVVEGRIGRSAPLRFALDTGTTLSMVDAKIADRLGLTLREGFVLNFDRNVRISWTTVPEISVGPLSLKEARVMVANLQQLTEFTDGIDGVIGLDVLRMTQKIAINLETRLVSFRINGASPPAASQGLQQAVLVRLNVQGKPLRLVLDSGARDVFLFEDRVKKHTPDLVWARPARNNHVGPVVAKIAACSEFRVGSTDVHSAFLMPKAPNSLPEDIDGYLGLSMLNARYVELDFEANVLKYVEKGPRDMVRASADEKSRGQRSNETLSARMALVALR